jgi:hypothetical protein
MNIGNQDEKTKLSKEFKETRKEITATIGNYWEKLVDIWNIIMKWF